MFSFSPAQKERKFSIFKEIEIILAQPRRNHNTLDKHAKLARHTKPGHEYT